MESVLELPCESVPRYLGCLYNEATGLFLNESITLWKNEAIEVAKESTAFQPSSNVEVIREDNFSDGMKNLGMSVSLTLGFLAGLLSVKGGVGFVVDRKKSRKVVRLTLKYQCTTKFEEISTNKVAKEAKSEKTFTSGEHEATHVVVGVLYGANAYFVFEKEITHTKNYDQVKGELELSISIFVASVSAGAAINVEHTLSVDTTTIKCTYHAEGFSSKAQTTSLDFNEALEMFRKLPQFIDEESVVPQKVWLLPLSYVPDTVGRELLKKVSSHYADEAMKIMDHLIKAVNQVDDLANHIVCSKFEYYKKKFMNFEEKLRQYRTKLALHFLNVLADVRRGDADEGCLGKIIEDYYSSPFSNSRLQMWFDTKEKEIILLGKCIEFLENAGIECIYNVEFQNIFCLNFHFYSELQAHEKEMNTSANDSEHMSVEGGQSSDDETAQSLNSGNENSMEWSDNPDFLTDMRQKVIEFVKFAKCNNGREGVKFFYKQVVNEHCPEDAFVVITLEGMHTVSPFILPGPPGKPEPSVVLHNAITVVWPKSERGHEQVYGYQLSYRLEKDDDGSWETCELIDDLEKTKMKVEGLLSNMSYIFRVQAVCRLWPESSDEQCVSEYSEVSNGIKTKRSKAADDYKTLIEKSNDENSKAKGTIENPSTSENGEIRKNPNSSETSETKKSIREIPPTSENDEKNYTSKNSDQPSQVENIVKIPVDILLEDNEEKVLKYSIGKPTHGHEDREVKTILLVHPPSEIEVLPVAEVIENLIMGVSWEDTYRLSLPYSNEQKNWLISYFFHWQEGLTIPYSLNIIVAPDMQLPMGGLSSAQLKHFDSVNLIAIITRPDVFPDLTLHNMCLIQSLFSTIARELEDCFITLQGPFDEPVNSIPELGITFKQQFDICGDGLRDRAEGSSSFWFLIAKGCNSFLKYLGQTDSTSLQQTVSNLERQENLLQKLEELIEEKKEVLSDQAEDANELDAINECHMRQERIISECNEALQEMNEISSLSISPNILSCLDNLNDLDKEKNNNDPTISSIRNKAYLIEHSLL